MIRRPPRSTLFPYTRSSDLCTGEPAFAVLQRVFAAQYVYAGLGSTIDVPRSEEHTSELQSQSNLVCRLLLEKKKKHRYVFWHLLPVHRAASTERVTHSRQTV